MINTLAKFEARFRELEGALLDPSVTRDVKRFQKLSKEYDDLKSVMAVGEDYRRTHQALAGNREIIAAGEDDDFIKLAKSEIPELEARLSALGQQLRLLLLPKDPNDDKAALVEIRAGTGGNEAALFAADLHRMYTRFAERKRWKMEGLSVSPSELGGFKEVVFLVEGPGAYGHLKFESGVHRVQRVPATEAQGRIHTSAASVVVMPEADEVDVHINSADLRIDVYRASGAGGQHVNKTDSAVRITHLPSGMVVACQDERSQHKNRAKAMKVLQARLLDFEREKKDKALSATRKMMVGTGDRSEKIRTFNFPQGRVTEHRIALTLYRLEEIVDGDLDEIIAALRKADAEERLRALA